MVLILGGLGMIGRNLVKYLVESGGESLVSKIRVVDRRLQSMVDLTEDYAKFFAHPLVECMQGDCCRDDVLNRAFQPPAGREPFALVVNLAAETRFGMVMEVLYEQNIVALRTKCAAKAVEFGVDKYIEVSTAQVYKTEGKHAAMENDASILKPWTVLGRYHLLAEQAVQRTKGLNWIIIRLPNVYGPADVGGLMPRVACAAAYEYCENEMQLLWDEDLRMHTVHVQDVAAAIWFLLVMGEVHQVYNIVDDNDTTQGKFNKVLESVFRLKTSFLGSIMSNVAQMKLDEISEQANQEHLDTWLEMCKETGVTNTPLTPAVDKELLSKRPLCIDGSKLKALGFQYSCPAPTAETILDSIQYWEKQGKFPRRSARR